MRLSSIAVSILAHYAYLTSAHPFEIQHHLNKVPTPDRQTSEWNSNISNQLFAELEELARVVDISYCVGTSGIYKPFECASRCDEFPDFELVDTFNTGPLMSDSCGYIVLDHGKKRVGNGRIIVAFRGTYSIANTIVDLSTVPQEYVPYPGSPDNSSDPHDLPKQKQRHHSFLELIPRPSWFRSKAEKAEDKPAELKCTNCTVHTGFWTSWQNTRPFILGHLEYLRDKYPDYRLDLVGHSLGGAVAALAGIEFDALGWKPVVTTFGEPRVGNAGLRNYVDAVFQLPRGNASSAPKADHSSRYRRITHVDDPVPLLPLQEWGYRAHAGEVYIAKPSLQPTVSDIRLCFGDEDINCIAQAEVDESWFEGSTPTAGLYDPLEGNLELEAQEGASVAGKRWGLPIPARYKMWQLFFAHRDYFWRLGLCLPGGDPFDWGRNRYDFGDEQDEHDDL
jgi:hypothetical protein